MSLIRSRRRVEVTIVGARLVHEKCEPQARLAQGQEVRQRRASGWFSWCPFWLLFGQVKSDKKTIRDCRFKTNPPNSFYHCSLFSHPTSATQAGRRSTVAENHQPPIKRLTASQNLHLYFLKIIFAMGRPFDPSIGSGRCGLRASDGSPPAARQARQRYLGIISWSPVTGHLKQKRQYKDQLPILPQIFLW